MFIDKKYKIEKAVSTESYRPTLTSAFIENKGEESKLIATNGNSLAMVPLVLDPEDKINGKNRLSVDAIKAIRKGNGRCTTGIDERMGDFVEIPGTSTGFPSRFLLGAEEFPDYKQVIPETENCDYHKVGINPKLLFELSQAIGAKTIELHLPKEPTGAIKVTDPDNNRVLGVIMPVRLNS